MGFFDIIKNRIGAPSRRAKNDELIGYLRASRDNLKLASENLNKFFEGVRDFQPARRHHEIYNEEVKNRLINMKSGINKGVIFIDERMNNNINTMNSIRDPNQLKDMISGWIKIVSANDEKVYDVLKILNVEMWSDERKKRGFPTPSNPAAACGYLNNAVHYLTEARDQIDSYVINNIPEP